MNLDKNKKYIYTSKEEQSKRIALCVKPKVNLWYIERHELTDGKYEHIKGVCNIPKNEIIARMEKIAPLKKWRIEK